jgi:hypothetical protein
VLPAQFVAAPPPTAAALRIDAPTRERVIVNAATLLDTLYVIPAAATRIKDSLLARLGRGEYEGEVDGIALARRLTADLRTLANDQHLEVSFSSVILPPWRAPSARPVARPPESVAAERRAMDDINCGFQSAMHLPGNVGYLRLDQFADTAACAATATAAIGFVAGARALVIDLRENEGGSARMLTFLASYLFDRRMHLDDIWTRSTGTTDSLWTQDSVPGRRFGSSKPVYILTSAHTFSAAEAFAYDLRAAGRATIVGEPTRGGAHLVEGRRLDDHFMIRVPVARAINPVTGTNWEGSGVQPDVKVLAADALTTALRLVGERASH